MTVSGMLNTALVWFSIVVLMVMPVTAQAEGAQQQIVFEVSPMRCVTLRQGQPCFVRVRFEWQSTEILQLCVYGLENEELNCWDASSGGTFAIPQTLPKTTDYILIDSEGVELSRATVSVSWVYRKKRSKRRWRLF